MSALSDDTLHKVLQQIQARTIAAQRELSIVKSQITASERSKKISQLTSGEIAALPQGDVKIYRGVGKMFVMEPRAVMERSLAVQEKQIEEELASLNKKAKQLENEYNKTQSQLRDIFHSQQQS
ncbi:Prefoldin [Calocera viscosa TUFC12733]|uniref:Prefoldin n=1 Tax=Calocera viscosa (strain TUFC12733) TaxID=1330018 RepID=A0A167FYZ1_CALVF|nr:Prefoldin [Calocera viscosa TUFC12733]